MGRPVTIDDLFNITLVGDPRLSPDGTQVAYVVTRLDKTADDYRSAVWLVPTVGGDPRQLTAGNARDSAPRWSPDGRQIAFVSTRPPHLPPPPPAERPPANGAPPKVKAEQKPSSQVWIVPVDGGEARQLTNQPDGASAPAWSPDGQTIAFLSAAADPGASDQPAFADERVISTLRYRHDGHGFTAGKHAQLWTVPAAGGEATQLTEGDVDVDQPAWSPDGTSVAFVGNRTPDRDRNGVVAVYRVAVSDRAVTPVAERDAEFSAPAWSPDGTQIAMLGHLVGFDGGRNSRVWLVPAAGGEPRDLTGDMVPTFDDVGMSDLATGADARPFWSADGRHLSALASAHGAVHLHRIDAATGTATPVTTGDRRVSAAVGAPDGTVVFLAGDTAHPFELFVREPDGRERQLTRHTADWLAEADLVAAETITVRSKSGDLDVQVWLLKPPGFDPARTYPVVLQIHGGPHAMYGHAPFHEMQAMAAKGWLVLFSNPRGSQGYGEAFATATRGRWGESDAPDVLAALDAVLARPYADPSRVAVTGGSYGGYLTNWLVGHTDRFRVAATQRCVSNFHSFYGTSDIGFDFGEWEFGGTPWASADLLLRHSPITYVDRIATPLLIVHNEGDLRCPIEQAEQMFVALKRLGRDVAFVRIPEEDHNLSRSGKPSRRIARLEHLIGWFDRHFADAPPSA